MTDIADIQSLAVAANTVSNVSVHTVNTDNATVGTSYELLTNINANITQLGTAGDGIEAVSSDNTDDKASGQGALTVTVRGLDTSFEKIESIITLDGTTGVDSSTTTWTFVNEAFVSSVGTLLNSTGAITIRNDAGSNDVAIIDAGQYKSGNCWWKVPAGHTGYVYGFWFGVLPLAVPVGYAKFALQIARHGLQGVAGSEVWETVCETLVTEPDEAIAVTEGAANLGGSFSFPGNQPIVIPEKAIVQIAALATSTAVAVQGGFNIVIQGSGAGTATTVN